MNSHLKLSLGVRLIACSGAEIIDIYFTNIVDSRLTLKDLISHRQALARFNTCC